MFITSDLNSSFEKSKLVAIDKQVGRVQPWYYPPHVIEPNEQRFHNINKFPIVLSNYKTTPVPNLHKTKGRSNMFEQQFQNDISYQPNYNYVMPDLNSNVPLIGKLTSRKNSIPSQNSGIYIDSDKIASGFETLSIHNRPKELVQFNKLVKRDYKYQEASKDYRPNNEIPVMETVSFQEFLPNSLKNKKAFSSEIGSRKYLRPKIQEPNQKEEMDFSQLYRTYN